MRTSSVRAFALMGALCCALSHLLAQSTAAIPIQPAAITAPTSDTGGVAAGSTPVKPSTVKKTGQTAQPSTTSPASPATAAGEVKAQPTSAAGNASPSTDAPPQVIPVLPVQARRPSLMIKRGGKEFEWRTTYSHSSKNTIFIDGVAIATVVTIGQVGVERISKDSLTETFSGRYGVANNLLAEIKVPFSFAYNRYSVPDVSPAQEKTVSGLGLGDMEGSFYYQFPRTCENDTRWIMNIGTKSTTGSNAFVADPEAQIPFSSGFWNAKIGFTNVNIVDPAAVFWNIGFTYGFERQRVPQQVTNAKGEVSTTYVSIKPGNTFDIGGGFAYAVNSRLSINTGVSISYNTSATAQGRTIANSAITSATLRMGAVWLTEQNFPVDIALSIGLTPDSPDFSLEFRRDIKF